VAQAGATVAELMLRAGHTSSRAAADLSACGRAPGCRARRAQNAARECDHDQPKWHAHVGVAGRSWAPRPAMLASRSRASGRQSIAVSNRAVSEVARTSRHRRVATTTPDPTGPPESKRAGTRPSFRSATPPTPPAATPPSQPPLSRSSPVGPVTSANLAAGRIHSTAAFAELRSAVAARAAQLQLL
jgi:hypothetical protein